MYDGEKQGDLLGTHDELEWNFNLLPLFVLRSFILTFTTVAYMLFFFFYILAAMGCKLVTRKTLDLVTLRV